MENVRKRTVMEEVNEGSEFILLIRSEEHYGTDAYYGTLEDLKAKIADYIIDGGDVRNCFIGLYQPLSHVDIKHKRSITIPFRTGDEEYEQLAEEYEVYVRGRKDESFYDLDNALDYVAELLEEDDNLKLEGDVQIIRKVEYDCAYEATEEIEIEIEIPPQSKEIEIHTRVILPDDMSTEELFQLRNKVNKLLLARHNGKDFQ